MRRSSTSSTRASPMVRTTRHISASLTSMSEPGRGFKQQSVCRDAQTEHYRRHARRYRGQYLVLLEVDRQFCVDADPSQLGPEETLAASRQPGRPRLSSVQARSKATERSSGPEIADLTDQAIDLFDHLVGTMFRKVESRHARAFQADGRAISEKVRLYARVGAALIAAREGRQDPFDAITAVIPWDRFRATVAEASALARSEEFDPYQLLGQHYAGVRRWTPAFLATFTFQGVPAAASLLRAIDMLRAMND